MQQSNNFYCIIEPMIAFLDGVLEFKDAFFIVVNVNGVGYKVTVPSSVSSKLNLGDKIKVPTYTHVREDILELYGFSNNSDLKLFENLISVSGVGPKTAIGVFSLGPSSEIIEAIVKGDVGYFTGVPRLGKKNAQKIIIELRSKVGSIGEFDLLQETDGKSGEIIEALKTFGFTTKESMEALKNIKGEGESVEDKIKLALRYLGK